MWTFLFWILNFLTQTVVFQSSSKQLIHEVAIHLSCSISTLMVSNGYLQFLPCSTNLGKDVIKNAIKFNPWDNSQLDLLHNYGLSATERAQAVDYLKKHPYTGPSTLQTVFEDPEFKDKLKHAADMQSVFEEIRKRRPEDPHITKTDIENADLNQLDGPNVSKIMI